MDINETLEDFLDKVPCRRKARYQDEICPPPAVKSEYAPDETTVDDVREFFCTGGCGE